MTCPYLAKSDAKGLSACELCSGYVCFHDWMEANAARYICATREEIDDYLTAQRLSEAAT